jgi:hypothetical protein
MWTCTLILDQLDILLKRCAAIKHRSSNIRHIFAEPHIFIPDLKGEFTGVAQDENRNLAIDRLDLLEGCKNKDCCFAQAGFCLAEDVGREDSLRETDLLYFRGVFETFFGGD